MSEQSDKDYVEYMKQFNIIPEPEAVNPVIQSIKNEAIAFHRWAVTFLWNWTEDTPMGVTLEDGELFYTNIDKKITESEAFDFYLQWKEWNNFAPIENANDK